MSSIAPENPLPSPQRRIRHISSIQIRNLTPFPVRDAIAQNLTQSGSNVTHGPLQHVDDIELTMARRRRRVSASSVTTIFINNAEDEPSSSPGTKKQVRSGSKGGTHSGKNVVSGSLSSSIRARPRNNSRLSATSLASRDSEPISPVSSLSTLFVTHSQRTLEGIVSSRLVETFITLTMEYLQVEGAVRKDQTGTAFRSDSPAPSTGGAKGKGVGIKRATSASAVTHRRGTSAPTTTVNSNSLVSRLARSHSAIRSESPPAGKGKGIPSSSTRTRPSSTTSANFPSPPPTPPPGAGPSRTKSQLAPSKSDHKQTMPEDGFHVPTPFYIAPIHAPSINPTFAHLDPEREFAPWADISASRLKISIWGRKVAPLSDNHSNVNTKGKGKENVPHLNIENEIQWRILDEWLIDLDRMQPFHVNKLGLELPSNTLLLTLSSGEVFQIPPNSSNKSAMSRASTPVDPGYSSDGDIEELRRQEDIPQFNDVAAKQEQEVFAKSQRETRMKKSATWQDLVKLVNLQTAIVDTEELLEEVVRSCDSLEDDGYLASLRECSEREEWISNLHKEMNEVLQSSYRAREGLKAREQAIQRRRRNLEAAQALLSIKVTEQKDLALEIISERDRHSELTSSLSPLRTNLIQEVAFIYPIEPLSAPDLLFTILGAPLPIPVNVSDPAPPPSVPHFSEVTEDNTATALGYVAQVLQFISVYLDKALIYPVTCCGSRSVIKDPISAMMGPRTFPLYSKGMETYRYEYGVFLLNKNIEMLMTERNLRAMDIRHTLPNLKNLLLTLTTGEEIKSVGLKAPIRAVSPLALDAQAQFEEESPPLVRKSTPFLSPLAAILRARYPSSIVRPSVKVVAEVPEPTVEEGSTTVESLDGNNAVIFENGNVGKAEVAAGAIELVAPLTPKAIGHPTEKLGNMDRSPSPPVTSIS